MNDEIKRCPNCGGELTPGESFCTGCGRELIGKIKKRKPMTNIFIFAAALIIVVIFYFILYPPEKKQPQQFQHPDISGTSSSSPDFSQMMNALPGSYDSLIAIGNLYMDRGIYQMAIESYRRAVAIDSTNPDILTDLGTCYHAIGKNEDAIVQFERSLALDPGHKITYLNLGVVYFSMNQPDMTKKYWGKLVELYPDDPIADTVRKYLGQLDSM